MKKLLFIPLLVLSSSLFAQTFQFGLKGGANLSNFTGTTFEGFNNKAMLGFHGGAFLSLLFGDHVALQPEAVFSTQGARLERLDNSGDDIDYRVTYLNIPVNLKYRFDGGFYLEGGPQVGFKLNENVDDQSTEQFARNLDFGLNAGLGFHSNSGFGIGGRYVVGISKVGNVDNTNFDPDFSNGVAQLFIFFTLFNNRNTP